MTVQDLLDIIQHAWIMVPSNSPEERTLEVLRAALQKAINEGAE